MSHEMLSLLSMPTEVLHSILNGVDPTDLSSISKSCRTLHEFVQNDALLWKQTYLAMLDEPIRDLNTPEPDWKTKLQKFTALQKILQSPNLEVKRKNINWVTEAISDFLQSASCRSQVSHPDGGRCARHALSHNALHLAETFSPDHRANMDSFLCGSSLFQACGTSTMNPYSTEEERQNAAKLHLFYGVPIDLAGKRYATHPFARSRVYDLRYYTAKTQWGPFSRDGKMDIDWENLEAVLVVLGYNFRVFRDRTNGAIPEVWNRPFAGIAQDAWPIIKEPELPMDDPYGCRGTWMRVVCFLDYTDLYSFNAFSDEAAQHKDPRVYPRGPLEKEEAIRLITCKLQVTKIEKPGPDDGQDLPVVHFQGDSRSRHAGWDPNAKSRLRGYVKLMKNGHIQWTTWSIFHGEERWRSEGIQVGGIRSARGILGNWFDKDFDRHGPVGPTAFWKVSNELVDDDSILPWI